MVQAGEILKMIRGIVFRAVIRAGIAVVDVVPVPACVGIAQDPAVVGKGPQIPILPLLSRNIPLVQLDGVTCLRGRAGDTIRKVVHQRLPPVFLSFQSVFRTAARHAKQARESLRRTGKACGSCASHSFPRKRRYLPGGICCPSLHKRGGERRTFRRRSCLAGGGRRSISITIIHPESRKNKIRRDFVLTGPPFSGIIRPDVFVGRETARCANTSEG